MILLGRPLDSWQKRFINNRPYLQPLGLNVAYACRLLSEAGMPVLTGEPRTKPTPADPNHKTGPKPEARGWGGWRSGI